MSMSPIDTRSARTSILQALRAAAPVALPLPDLASYRRGPFAQGSEGPRVDPSGLLEPFEKAARGWRAEVVHAETGTWPQVVRDALERRGCRRVAIGAASPLQPQLDVALQGLAVRRFDQPLEHWKAEMFEAIDAGISATVAGIADTGTLMLRPDEREPRTLSLVPPVHVAVLKASMLYASLDAAVQAHAAEADMPTNLLLVSGPSKTADIQQTLAYGAHGPKELVIVLVHDLPTAAAEST